MTRIGGEEERRAKILGLLRAGKPLLSGGAGPYTATFESGVNGATIQTTDTGALTAWDVVAPGALTDGTRAYDNTHAAHGGLSGKIAAATTDKQIYLQWSSTTLGTLSSDFGRIYLWLTATPAANFNLVIYLHTGSSTAASISITNARKFTAGDSTGTKATSTNAIPTGQWVRLEWNVTFSATVGNLTVNYYATADSVTITETIGNGGNYNTTGSANTVRFGNTNGASIGTNAFWLDDVVAGATSYPGPAGGTPNITPTTSISATSAVSGYVAGSRPVGTASMSCTSALSGSVTKPGASRPITPTTNITATSAITFRAPDIYATSTLAGAVTKATFDPVTPITSINATSPLAASVTIPITSQARYGGRRTDGFAHTLGFPR